MTEFTTQMNYAVDHILTDGAAHRIDVIEEIGRASVAEWMAISGSPDSIEMFHVFAGNERATFSMAMSMDVWIVETEQTSRSSDEWADSYRRGRWDVVSVSGGES